MNEGAAAEVLAANDAFYRAFAAMDYAAMDGLWARTVAVACVHPLGELLRGRDEVMEAWRAILGNPDQPRVVSGGAEATVLGDLAFVVCREYVAGTPINATNIFAREDGLWRIAHHHSSPMVMLAE